MPTKAYELTQARSDRKRYLMRFANNAAVAARYNQDHTLAVARLLAQHPLCVQLNVPREEF